MLIATVGTVHLLKKLWKPSIECQKNIDNAAEKGIKCHNGIN